MSTKQLILETIYPIGSIYMSTINENPNTALGFGTWVSIKNRYVFANNHPEEGGYDFITTDMMPMHEHGIEIQLSKAGKHTHIFNVIEYESSNGDQTPWPSGRTDWCGLVHKCQSGDNRHDTNWIVDTKGSHSHLIDVDTGLTGKTTGQKKLLPSYRGFYIWHRTA